MLAYCIHIQDTNFIFFSYIIRENKILYTSSGRPVPQKLLDLLDLEHKTGTCGVYIPSKHKIQFVVCDGDPDMEVHQFVCRTKDSVEEGEHVLEGKNNKIMSSMIHSARLTVPPGSSTIIHLKIVLFCEILKSQDVQTCVKIVITTRGRPRGSKRHCKHTFFDMKTFTIN